MSAILVDFTFEASDVDKNNILDDRRNLDAWC